MVYMLARKASHKINIKAPDNILGFRIRIYHIVTIVINDVSAQAPPNIESCSLSKQ